MKEFKERLLRVQGSQDALMKEYQNLMEEYEAHDLLYEVEELRKQVEDYQARLQLLQERLGSLEEENSRLSVALTEQIVDEKLNLIKVSREKLETYFSARIPGQKHRLKVVEEEAKRKCQDLLRQAERELGQESRDYALQIEQLAADMKESILRRQQRLEEEERRLRQDTVIGLNDLASEPVDAETVKKRIKQNRMELKIGLNWLNRLAILLLVIGVGAAFRYSYGNWFGDHLKGVTFFVLGALMLAAGEWLYRKGKRVFAVGLLGGGISVWYGSVFYSYFLLGIIGMYAALILAVAVTVAAVLLALRSNSQTICALGLIGGYLPLFTYMFMYIEGFEFAGAAVYAGMTYLLLLNLSVVIVSFRKRWLVVHYISFFMHTPTMAILSLEYADSIPLAMVYVLLTFILYLVVTLRYPLAYRIKLKAQDIVLLALNTVISCSVLYGLFNKADLNDYMGLLALAFCVTYWGLAQLTQRLIRDEKETIFLFYATSLAFAILVIPFQFGRAWLSTGWLVEAVVLMVIGNLKQLRRLERSGWLVLVLCLAAFIWVDILLMAGIWGRLADSFHLKYALITVALALLTLFYGIRRNAAEGGAYIRAVEADWIKYLKYAAMINLWIYLVYEIHQRFQSWIPADYVLYDFYRLLLVSVVTIALGYGYRSLSLLYDGVVRRFSIALYLMGALICFAVTLDIPAVQQGSSPATAAEYIALAILAGCHVLIFFSARQFLIGFIRGHYKNVELYPLLMGMYIAATLTVYLSVQFRLASLGFLFSVIYLLLAIAYIVYGFRRRYVYIRRLGLGLSLFATAKLFVYDLSFLSAGYKVVAYFCFGLALLGISYLYQRISDKVESDT